MTHEYVIALGGLIVGAATEGSVRPTAIAWAAGTVLAVGPDEVVRAISRGDSTFLDLAGCAVTATDPRVTLEPGAPADLAFWRGEPGVTSPVATVRAGHFLDGDEHEGPFHRLPGTASVEAAHG